MASCSRVLRFGRRSLVGRGACPLHEKSLAAFGVREKSAIDLNQASECPHAREIQELRRASVGQHWKRARSSYKLRWRKGGRGSGTGCMMSVARHRSAARMPHLLLVRGDARVMESHCSRRAATRVSEGDARHLSLPVVHRSPRSAAHQWKFRSLLLPSPLAAMASRSRLLALDVAARWKRCCPLHEKLLAAFGVQGEAGS
ncbi:hypothetical protein Dimus_011484 [Dionaea muscipula]